MLWYRPDREFCIARMSSPLPLRLGQNRPIVINPHMRVCIPLYHIPCGKDSPSGGKCPYAAISPLIRPYGIGEFASTTSILSSRSVGQPNPILRLTPVPPLLPSLLYISHIIHILSICDLVLLPLYFKILSLFQYV